jgi:hypothetical protein
MQWELIVALVVAIPVILFPATYVWYLNIGGIYTAVSGEETSSNESDRLGTAEGF